MEGRIRIVIAVMTVLGAFALVWQMLMVVYNHESVTPSLNQILNGTKSFKSIWGKSPHPEAACWSVQQLITAQTSKQQVLELLGAPDATSAAVLKGEFAIGCKAADFPGGEYAYWSATKTGGWGLWNHQQQDPRLAEQFSLNGTQELYLYKLVPTHRAICGSWLAVKLEQGHVLKVILLEGQIGKAY